jgi:hypothetical protein
MGHAFFLNRVITPEADKPRGQRIVKKEHLSI